MLRRMWSPRSPVGVKAPPELQRALLHQSLPAGNAGGTQAPFFRGVLPSSAPGSVGARLHMGQREL